MDFMCYQPDEMAKEAERMDGRPESAKTILDHQVDEQLARPNKVRDAMTRKERGRCELGPYEPPRTSRAAC